jgi:hypothetical protein
MPRRATTVLEEEPEMSTGAAVSDAAMEQRRRLVGLVRARMAKPATAAEKKLWQELKAEVEKERLTFRS